MKKLDLDKILIPQLKWKAIQDSINELLEELAKQEIIELEENEKKEEK